jgi:protein arginine N-methyltransferase 1
MYTIADYASMMADVTRIDAYAAALAKVVRADSIVADLGSGTGMFALLAARSGARKVYAIEPDDAIHVGRTLAAANGLVDRIEFIQARSTDVSLSERVTVIVSDIRGTLPLFERHLPAIVDARERLLGGTGTLIPRRDRVWAAIVEAHDLWAGHVRPWRNRTYGLHLEPVQELLVNTWRRSRMAPDDLLSNPECMAVIDYRNVADPNLDAEATWEAARIGTAHGVCLWFDTELADGIGFSNAPHEPGTIHGQAFFPFVAPVALDQGESLSVRIQADLVGDDYVWRWTCRGREQSTLGGVPLGSKQLAKGSASHVPVLTTDGEIDLFVLSRMCQAMPLGRIALELLEWFPSAIRDRNAALGRAGDLARKYTKDEP